MRSESYFYSLEIASSDSTRTVKSELDLSNRDQTHVDMKYRSRSETRTCSVHNKRSVHVLDGPLDEEGRDSELLDEHLREGVHGIMTSTFRLRG